MISSDPPAPSATSKSVLFHVGLPKAASSFLQRRVFPAITDAAFLHPTSANLGRLPAMFGSSSAFLAEPEAARQAILETAPAKVIISAESFVGDPYDSFCDHDSRTAGLKAIWPEAAILLVIRRQDHFCRSLFGQALRKGFPYAPARFLLLDDRHGAAGSKTRRFDYRAADLDRIVQRYENLFGAAKVHVFPLELLAENAAAFVDAVLNIGDYKLAALPEAKVENRTYSSRGYRAARLLNRFCLDETDSGARFFSWLDRRSAGGSLGWRACRSVLRTGNRAIKRRIRRVVERIGSSGMESAQPLKDCEMSLIRQHFAASNRALSQRRNLGLERYGYF